MCPAPLTNTLCSVVLFESRDLTGAIFPRSAGVLSKHGSHAVLRERLGVLGARLDHQHRPRIDIGDEAEEVQQDLGLHHLRRRQQHHLAARMGRAEHVHRLALIRTRAPLASLGSRAAREDAVLVGPLRDQDVSRRQHRRCADFVDGERLHL